MAAPIRKISSLPGQAQLTALRLAAAGYPEGTWYYSPNHNLADPGMGVQVRGDKDRAPRNKVKQYAGVMKDFTLNRDQLLFPPVVFTSDDYLVDGWTRTEAARELDWMTFPAIVLLDSYQGADEARLDKFMLTGGALNLDHGNNLSIADTERLILNVSKGLDLSTPGAPAEIAKRLGISRSWVSNLLNARTAYERAERLGIDLSHAPMITRTHMAYLGNNREKLSNPVFAELLKLMIDAKLSTTDTPPLARRVFAEEDEQKKLDLLAGERASLDGLITGHSTRPSDAARMRRALGNITKYRTNPGLAVEDNPANAGLHEEVIDDAIAVLYTIKSAQRKQNHERALAAEMG
jgi:transcriptional regulator with XRE-family HTH domain